MNKAKKLTSILAASFMFATAFATMTLVNSSSTTVSSLDGLKLVSEDTGTLVKLASKKNANAQATLSKESAYYSVRLGADAGLRFKYNFTKDMLSAAFSTDDVDLSSYTFGVYVAKSTDLAGDTLTSKVADSTVKKLQIEATNKVVTADDVTFAAVLVGFNDEAKYNTEFTSVAYASNGTTTLYSAESSYSYMKAINYYLDEGNEVHNQLSAEQVSELTTLKEDNEVGYRVVEEDGNLNLYQYGVKSNTNIGSPIKTVAKPAVSTATYTVDLKNKGTSTNSGTLYAFNQQGNVYTSSNQGKSSSNASMVVTATSAGTIVFNYDVQGEAKYDYLTVYHNKNVAQNSEGKDIDKSLSTTVSITGSATIEVEEGDTLTFSYTKDGSGDKGNDCAIITLGLANVSSSVVTYDTMGAGAYTPSIAINGAVVESLPTPTKDGYYFDGWYTSTDYAADDKVSSSTVLSGDATLYAHWLDMEDASPLMGTYYGYDVYGTSTTLSKSNSYNPTLTVDFNGNYTATYASSSSSVSRGKLENYDETTKSFDGNIYYDATSGLIVMAHLDNPTASAHYTVYVVGSTGTVSTSNVNGANFDDGKYHYVNTGKGEIFIDVLANKVYFDVKAYDIEDKVISVTSSSSISNSTQLVVTVKQGETTLKTFGYDVVDDDDYGSSTTGFYTTTLPSGVFKVEGTNNTVKLTGTQYLIYDKYSSSTKMKFTKQGSDNVLKTSSTNYSYTFTFNYEEKTVAVVENKYTITYNWNGHEYPNTSNTTSVWDGSWLYTPKPSAGAYVEENGSYYVFKGWYTDEALTTEFKQVRPTTDMTLYAKWVDGVKVTLDANGGTCTKEYLVIASGECPELPDATHTEKIFIGWYNGNDEVTNETVISSDVKLVAKWKDAPFYVGKYTGYNVDHSNFGSESGKSLNYNFVMTPDGKVTGKTTTTWEEANYDSETGMIIFKNNAHVYVLNSSTGIVVAAAHYSFNSTLAWDDYGIYAKYTSDDVKPSFNVVYWNNGYDKLIEVTLGDKVTYVFSDGTNKKMYIDVTMSDFSGNAIAFADVYKDSALTTELVLKADNVEVGKFKAINDTRYGYTSNDGHSGTFTGSLNGANSTVVIDGYGTATVNGVDGTYTYENGTYTVVCDGVTYEFTVTDSSLSQVLDGSEGTYTGSLGNLVLTGYGKATLGGTEVTYTVSGTLVTITIGEKVTYVSIDKTANTYEVVTLSKFSSCLFTGSGACNEYQGTMKIQFDEGAAITGIIGFNYSVSASDYNTGIFKGEYNDETKTLTLTITSSPAGSDLVGKVYVFSVADGKLTYVSSTASRNIFVIDSNYTLTCKDFKA